MTWITPLPTSNYNTPTELFHVKNPELSAELASELISQAANAAARA
jgi:hypothetical protein